MVGANFVPRVHPYMPCTSVQPVSDSRDRFAVLRLWLELRDRISTAFARNAG